MREREKIGVQLNPKDWARNMDVLNGAATILQKNEAAQKLFETQAQARVPAPEPPLSEKAQRIAQLTEVDRQLLRDAGEKLRTLLKRRKEEAAEGP